MIRDTIITFVLGTILATLSYLSPEIFNFIYGVYPDSPGEFYFMAGVVMTCNFFFLYISIRRYLKDKREKNSPPLSEIEKKHRKSIADHHMKNEVAERLKEKI